MCMHTRVLVCFLFNHENKKVISNYDLFIHSDIRYSISTSNEDALSISNNKTYNPTIPGIDTIEDFLTAEYPQLDGHGRSFLFASGLLKGEKT